MVEGNQDLEYYRKNIRDCADIRIGRYSFKEDCVFMDDIDESLLSRIFHLQGHKWFMSSANLLNLYITEEYDNNVKSNKGGRALAGGLMFGTVGAVVGAASGTQTQVRKLTKLKLKFEDDDHDIGFTLDMLSEFHQISVDVQTLKYEEIMNFTRRIINWYNRYS